MRPPELACTRICMMRTQNFSFKRFNTQGLYLKQNRKPYKKILKILILKNSNWMNNLLLIASLQENVVDVNESEKTLISGMVSQQLKSRFIDEPSSSTDVPQKSKS